MTILEKLKAKYTEQSENMRSMEIKGLDITIYARPVTLGQRDRISKYARKLESNLAVYVYAVILCALDEDGSNLFEMKDKPELMNKIDGTTLIEMGQFIYGADGEPEPEDEDEDEDDTSKNS